MTEFKAVINTCREYLTASPKVNQVFSVPTHNGDAFLYEYGKGEDTGTMILRIHEQLEAVVLEARLNIAADKHSFFQAANYCQFNSDPFLDPGCLVAAEDPSHSIYYKISSPFDTISANSLEWMSDCAIVKLKAHLARLSAIASGDFYKLKDAFCITPDIIAEEPDRFLSNIERTKAILAEAFKKHDNRNMVGTNLDTKSNVLFYNQIRYDDSLFWEKIVVSERGYMIVAVKPELRCNNPKCLSLVCNRWTDNSVIGSYHAYSDDGSVWCTAPISLENGPVSYEVFEAVERCLVVSTHLVLSDLRKSSKSYFPIEEDSEDEFTGESKLLQRMELLDKLHELRLKAAASRDDERAVEIPTFSSNSEPGQGKDLFDSILDIFSSNADEKSSENEEDTSSISHETRILHPPAEDSGQDDLIDLFIGDHDEVIDIESYERFGHVAVDSEVQVDFDRCFAGEDESSNDSDE